MFLIQLCYPANCINFFGQLFTLVSFNVIPTEYIYEKVFKISTLPDSHLSDDFKWVGYQSMLTVNNMASIFAFLIIAPIGVLTLQIFNVCFPFWIRFPDKYNKKVQTYVDEIIKGAFWNSPLSFIN